MKLITFDIDKNTNAEGMVSVFKAFESWACITLGTWLVSAPNTDCETIRNILMGMKPKHLVILDFKTETCKWATYGCTKNINEYLHNNL